MTTQTVAAAPATGTRPAFSAASALRVVAGTVLVAGPLLWAAGMATSPVAADHSSAAYLSSLGRDATLTQVSALLLHYGNLAIGLGVLAASGLVRGRRGAVLTLVGSLLAAFGFTNVAGMLLSDFWNHAAATTLPLGTAVRVFEAEQSSALLPLWDATEPLSLIGSLVLLVGLARAGVIGWWGAPVLVAGIVGLMFVPLTLPVVSGALVAVAFAPLALVGVRLLQRARSGRD